MCDTTTSTAAGSTTVTAVHPDVIRSHILTKLDGADLAAASCASSQFLSLCGDDRLWRQMCNYTWPSTADPAVQDTISSLPSGHRSFYSDCFPSACCHRPDPSPRDRTIPLEMTPEFLIFAVDIYCDGKLMHSKVLKTETISGWFRSSPLRIDLLSHKETLATPMKSDGDGDWMARAADRLRVSWIVIDPRRKRAVNVAGAGTVEARLHWQTGDAQLRYATVVDGGGGEMFQCGVMVTAAECGGEDLVVREVSLRVEDVEGKVVAGTDGLRVLGLALDGRRRRADGKAERGAYEMFMRAKVRFRERKERRERRIDMACLAVAVWIFVSIWVFFLWR